MSIFQKSHRRKAKLRLALCGPSGSGKTYSALKIALGMGGRIALVDTENGSGHLYSNICDYDVAEIAPPFSIDKYIGVIKAAEQAGYDVLIIDSLSHAWAGQGGLLEEVDKRKGSSKNSFGAWRDITPMHNQLIDTIIQSKMHIIVTMRAKTAYEIEKDEKGKATPVKKGMAPIQRDGLEYEFTVVLDLDNEKHIAQSGKDRTGLFDGKYFVPDESTGTLLMQWLEMGVEMQPQYYQPPAPAYQQPAYQPPAPMEQPQYQEPPRQTGGFAHYDQEIVHVWTLGGWGVDAIPTWVQLRYGRAAHELTAEECYAIYKEFEQYANQKTGGQTV